MKLCKSICSKSFTRYRTEGADTAPTDYVIGYLCAFDVLFYSCPRSHLQSLAAPVLALNGARHSAGESQK